jgi:hypothetical protein
MATSLDARAAFSQANCPGGAWSLPIPTEIGALEYMKQSTAPAGGASDMTLYNHSTNQHWKFFVNSNVNALRGYFGYFVTEPTYDRLEVNENGGLHYSYSGTKNASLVQRL